MTKEPLISMKIPKAWGSISKEQLSEIVKFRFTILAPRINPTVTKTTNKNVSLDPSAKTVKLFL